MSTRPDRDDPLVVTLALDDDAQARFDAERAAWFPPGRTQVGAHVTLFHALPGDQRRTVEEDLTAATRRDRFAVHVTGLVSLGRGVAYRLEAPELVALHAGLRTRWLPHLTAQDAQPFRAHVTVQNKVTPEVARATLASLAAAYVPFAVTAVGVDLWRYAGGPWVPLARFAFDP